MYRFHQFLVLKRWYEEYLTINNYRPRSIKDYIFELSYFQNYLATTEINDISEITPEILRDFAASLFAKKRSAATIHHKLSVLNSFFKALYEEHKLYLDLRNHLHLPRVHKKLPVSILSEKEIERVFTHLESQNQTKVETIQEAVMLRNRAIFEVFYSTGIRRNELTSLKLADLDYDHGFLFINQGKGGKDRIIPLGRTALEVVKRYVTEARPILAKNCDYLFVTKKDGLKLGSYTIRQSIIQVTKAAGITKHVKVHGLRHTCATHLLNNGADIRIVQELLGHKCLSSTQVYTHVSIKKLQETHQKYHPREQLNG